MFRRPHAVKTLLLAALAGPARGRAKAGAGPDRDGPTGRVKLGTESCGGFRNIAVPNCTFDRSRGLALETVDGGDVEDVTVTNLTMRDVTTAPFFLRVGNRGRTPGDPPPGRMRRIVISGLSGHDSPGLDLPR